MNLEKGLKWSWNESQQKAFEKAKRLITFDTVLAHYDPDMDLYLACDASPYGIGAVLTLSHKFENGSKRPIAYISKTLTKAERNYAQIDRSTGDILGGKKIISLSFWTEVYTDYKSPTINFKKHPCNLRFKTAKIHCVSIRIQL